MGLAKLELNEAIDVLASWFPDVKPAVPFEELQYRFALIMRAPEELPVMLGDRAP